MPPVLHVTLLSRPGEDKRHRLVTSTVTIGRDPSSSVCLNDPYLSRNQAVITERNGCFHVHALQCTSATWLFDEKLEPGPDGERELHDEDELYFGRDLKHLHARAIFRRTPLVRISLASRSLFLDLSELKGISAARGNSSTTKRVMGPVSAPLLESVSAPAVEVADDDQQHKRARVDSDTQTDAQPLAVSVDLQLSRADQLGIDAAWLFEYGSPKTASFLSFLTEATTNFQRGFPPIPTHCLARPCVASGNDKTSAPAMNSRAQRIVLLVDGVSKHLRKSILSAKTTFNAQDAAFCAVLRAVPYTAKEEAEAQMEEAEDSGEAQEAAPHHLLMHRFVPDNMIGDTKTSKIPGICVGSALHFERLIELSRGEFDLSDVPCSYENGEYVAMALCTAFGRAELHGGERRFDLLRMVARESASCNTMDDGGLPYRRQDDAPRVGNFVIPWRLKTGESTFLVKCMDQGMHVGSFLIGSITHPGHDERHPTEAQTAMRAQLIHNLLSGRITREETLYLHKEDLDAVFLKYGRTVQ